MELTDAQQSTLDAMKFALLHHDQANGYCSEDRINGARARPTNYAHTTKVLQRLSLLGLVEHVAPRTWKITDAGRAIPVGAIERAHREFREREASMLASRVEVIGAMTYYTTGTIDNRTNAYTLAVAAQSLWQAIVKCDRARENLEKIIQTWGAFATPSQ